ncbi:MAG: hypothetical protein P1V21_17990 [Rhizobiaceae bacterium]|nr:hypothetical protein [Rhizobiaceae bacterium]
MDDDSSYAEALQKRIEDAYVKSGNRLGWRLLASPAHVVNHAGIALLGLHPGGRVKPAHHAEFAMASGSAYEVEQWANHPAGQNPLQVQVRTLFELLDARPEDVLAGNLVPFRSPNIAGLQNSKAAFQFGEQIWDEILNRARPRLVIGMGRQTREILMRLLGVKEAVSVPLGWGNITGTRGNFEGGVFVGLPHLSQYKIMRRPKSTPAIEALFEGYVNASVRPA